MVALPETLLAVARVPALAVGLPIGLGMLVGLTNTPKSSWYASLKQPPGNPPDWAFGPVWTILYGMMGYASHLAVKVYDNNLSPLTSEHASDALGLYYAQLAMNLIWTPLFFTAKKPKLALANIGVLTALVVSMTAKMKDLPTNPNTIYLLAPYCAWLGYATYLNGGIVYENWNRPQVNKRS